MRHPKRYDYSRLFKTSPDAVMRSHPSPDAAVIVYNSRTFDVPARTATRRAPVRGRACSTESPSRTDPTPPLHPPTSTNHHLRRQTSPSTPALESFNGHQSLTKFPSRCVHRPHRSHASPRVRSRDRTMRARPGFGFAGVGVPSRAARGGRWRRQSSVASRRRSRAPWSIKILKR